MARLVVIDGANRGLAKDIGDAAITIGQHATSGLVLRDDRVSRMHAVVVRRGSEIVLTDKDSTNGTYVNGFMVDRAILRNGDVILLGKTSLRYEDDAAAPSRDLETSAPVSHAKTIGFGTTDDGGAELGTRLLPAAPGSEGECDVTSVLHKVIEDMRPAMERYHVEIHLPERIVARTATDEGILSFVVAGIISVCLEQVVKAGPPQGGLRLNVQPEQSNGLRLSVNCSDPAAMRDAMREGLRSSELHAYVSSLQSQGVTIAVGAQDAPEDEIIAIILPRPGD